jgi:nicotinamide-nucleotide amidase
MFHAPSVDALRTYLLKEKQTISVAESVTSGFFQAALSSGQDASQFFQGGITAYNLGQKCRHLNIEPIHATSCNCVSEKMAQDMALNVSAMFISDWGIATTGYASTVPESDNKLFAYYAISFKGEIVSSGRINTEDKNPIDTQVYFVNCVLEELVKYTSKPAREAKVHA